MKYFKRFFLIAMAIILVFGCQNDDEETKPNNYFEFDGTSYEVLGSFELDQSGESGNKEAISFGFGDVGFDIKIVDDEIEILNPMELSGHNAVSLTNGWSYNGTLESGEYKITRNSDFECSIGISFNIVDEDYAQDYEIINGTVIIEVGEDSYSFRIEGITEDGSTLKLEYFGKPDYYHIVNRE